MSEVPGTNSFCRNASGLLGNGLLKRSVPHMVSGHLLGTTNHHLEYAYHMARTSKADLMSAGTASFVRAVRSLGLQVSEARVDEPWDLLVTVEDTTVPVGVDAAAVVNPEMVHRLIAQSSKRKGVIRVVVGDLITGPARDVLRDAGWGWLDRRGHLALRAKGVYINVDVPADDRHVAGPHLTPISGVSGITWAAALLMTPEAPPSMRSVARRVSLSHSAIVTAAKRLREASLVRADGRPLVPELFWALADVWHPRHVALAELPKSSGSDKRDILGLNLDEEGSGWAVAGTVGAAAWGAPLAIGSAYPPDFYAPSVTHLRQAALRLRETSRFEERACTVAVAPTPLVCVDRFRLDSNEWDPWRFAHGLFAALDLAQDRARGAETLADWNPADFTRVW